MRYKLRVTKEDGTIDLREVEAPSFSEAKDMLMGEPDVIDVVPAKAASIGSQAITGNSDNNLQPAIDQYVGTDKDVRDMIGTE